MTTVGRRFHGREPSEPLGPVPHRAGPGGRPAGLFVGGCALAVALLAGCGGGPDASVGVARVDGVVEVRAKACGDGGIERVDLVDPAVPEAAVWSARATDPAAVRRTIPVGEAVPGYAVDDRRPAGALPERVLRVLVQGPDGSRWGGPRFTPGDLEDGVLRVAGREVPLAEWEAEPARCPEVGLVGALAGGVATAVVAGLLWLVVRTVTRRISR